MAVLLRDRLLELHLHIADAVAHVRAIGEPAPDTWLAHTSPFVDLAADAVDLIVNVEISVARRLDHRQAPGSMFPVRSVLPMFR